MAKELFSTVISLDYDDLWVPAILVWKLLPCDNAAHEAYSIRIKSISHSPEINKNICCLSNQNTKYFIAISIKSERKTHRMANRAKSIFLPGRCRQEKRQWQIYIACE